MGRGQKGSLIILDVFELDVARVTLLLLLNEIRKKPVMDSLNDTISNHPND